MGYCFCSTTLLWVLCLHIPTLGLQVLGFTNLVYLFILFLDRQENSGKANENTATLYLFIIF